MFKSIRTDIKQLDEEREFLEADWKAAEHRLLQFYVKVVPKVLDVERCSIFVADRDAEGMWLRAGTGVRERSIEMDELSESVLGEAVAAKKTIYKDNLQDVQGSHQAIDTLVGFETRDILCMPIFSLDGKRLTGAVQLLNKKDGAPYSEDDLILLEEMLHYLELSIENIYYQQEASGVMGKAYQLLRKTTMGATLAFFGLLVAFSLYWTIFFLLG
ncbi:MAG: GAF domain-containing protein [Pseudomonadales bacterium]